MIICKTRLTLKKILQSEPDYSLNSGFAPTMGALHDGHLSLIAAAKKKCKIVVASIFVNPTQFNDPADFDKYPVTLSDDVAMLEAAGCDVLFLPSVAEMYPEGTLNLEQYDLGRMDQLLEGAYRPGHFQGVCQVMQRLLDMVKPGHLFMGGKDYQQCMVVQQLIDMSNIPVHLHICPTLRENDGLAMSSRNMRLSAEARCKAPAMYQTLHKAAYHSDHLSPEQSVQNATEELLRAGFEHVDYVSIADLKSLEPVITWPATGEVVVLGAAFVDGVRLIDNVVVPVGRASRTADS